MSQSLHKSAIAVSGSMLGLYDNMIEVFSDSARSIYIEAAILVLPSSKMEKKTIIYAYHGEKTFC